MLKSLEEIEEKLNSNKLKYEKKKIANGFNLKFENGVILQWFTNKKIYFSGKKDIEFINKIICILNIEEKFTEDEKAILRNLPREYEWITRTLDPERICCSVNSLSDVSKTNKWVYLDMFKHLFKNIEYNKPCEFRKYL